MNNLSNMNYNVGNEIIYNTKILKSNLCDYNNAYILVRGDITIVGDNATQAAFENCAPFTKCIIKFDGTAICDADDLDLVARMYNLLEYSPNYSNPTGSLWFHSIAESMLLTLILRIMVIFNLSSIRLIY